VIRLRDDLPEVVLALSSDRFGFERAQAKVIPSNWDNPSNLARGDPAALYEATDVVDDRIASVIVPGPGEFLLSLTQLTVRRFHDHLRFLVPWFASRFELTDADIQHGSARVSLNPTGVFRVSIFDRARQLLQGRQLTIYHDGMTIRLVSDEHGAILFLGNPTQFSIDPEMAVITIESL
jgi:hypothetical protein